MAWPIKVARKAPAMPSTVVRMNPLGLFGPGDSNRAMIPATKPTMMIQRMPLMVVVLRLKSQSFKKPASNPARQFAFARQPPIRRQMIDHVGEILAKALEQFVARH